MSLDTKKQELLIKIKNRMQEYRAECSELDVLKWLNDHGNEYYQSLNGKKNGIDFNKIKEHDIIYISKFFDVLEWWKIKESLYPELAVGACIVLGKPTHNAFQERVFSRGTYTDTKLRKQLKEESFEMSVLNAVNSSTIESNSIMIDEINNKIYSDMMEKKKLEELMKEEMNEFNKKREQEKLFDFNIVDNVVEKEKIDDDEVISVISDNQYNLDYDNDSDDDEVFNQLLAKNWVSSKSDNNTEAETVSLVTEENNNTNNVVERDETTYH